VATVRIGERDLEVKIATLGMLKKKLIPARAALKAATEEESPDRMAEIVHCYVGHNPDVTVEWLLETLPADPSEILRACIAASGQKVREPAAGEATGP
jgi:hypothetical protein